jgi:hypothetical protein
MTATARRGHGEGSIYRDAANGTWVGAISLGWRPDGTRIRRKVTGRTKADLQEKLKRLRAEAGAGVKTSASCTLAKAVNDWGRGGPGGVSCPTVTSHVDLLRPVTMLIGQIPSRDLTAHDVRRTLNRLAETRSTRTVASTHNVLVRAIRHAEAKDPPRFGAYVILSLTTGIRTEEGPLCSLDWSAGPSRGCPGSSEASAAAAVIARPSSSASTVPIDTRSRLLSRIVSG